MKIDLASTFLLSDALSRGALRVEPRMHLDEMAVLRGQPERKPLEFVHAEGRRRLDLVGTGYAMLYLVSDRFIDVLSGAKFTGWTTYPVRIVDESGHEVSGYHGLSVRGRSGALDPERAERVTLPAPPGGKAMRGWRGLCFDPWTWDGSDLFVPEGTGHILVVQEAKIALEKARLSNIDFRRITDIERLWP